MGTSNIIYQGEKFAIQQTLGQRLYQHWV